MGNQRTKEPGGLQPWGHRVGHHLATKQQLQSQSLETWKHKQNGDIRNYLTRAVYRKMASHVAHPTWHSGKESTCQCKRRKKRVWSLGQEDPLEEEVAIHSSICDWKIPWTEEPGGLHSMGSQGTRHDLVIKHEHMLTEQKFHQRQFLLFPTHSPKATYSK